MSSRKQPPGPRTEARLPRHVAIIMDGNNRWDKARQEAGMSGHRAGAATARKMVYHCADRGIDYLTLFVFSSENWLRPKREVNGLMALFLHVLQRQEVNQLHERGIRLRFIGARDRFSPKLRQLMEEGEALTAGNSGMTVVVAADYGGRWDITAAARKLAEDVARGALRAADIDEARMSQAISLGDAPMPDLCIRTGGEQRISNFLLWQMAYTELYFTDTLWPDFDAADLDLALADYARRQRRFGRLSEQVESGSC